MKKTGVLILVSLCILTVSLGQSTLKADLIYFERGNGWDEAAELGFLNVTNGSGENDNFAQIVKSGNGFFTFHTNESGVKERMRISNNGNVGIGTYNPEGKLEVAGSLIVGKREDAGVINFRRGSDGHEEFNQIGFNGINEVNDFAFKVGSGDGFFSFHTNEGGVEERMRISNNGNVGIGTNNPEGKLEVAGSLIVGKKEDAGVIKFRRGSDGHEGSNQIGFNGTNEVNDFAFKVGSGSGFFSFHTNEDGVKERMRISNHGNVGIGTDNPTALLTVKGTILAERVQVKKIGADYVFADDYGLRSLSEVEKFITKNDRLPGIAPATETEKGVDLGAFTEKLLEKIEELTLYTIQQEKRLDVQQKLIESLLEQQRK